MAGLMDANTSVHRALAAYGLWLRGAEAQIEVSVNARDRLIAALTLISASIAADVIRTKVPEPWQPDPKPVDTSDPESMASAWEEELQSLEEWDPSIGDGPGEESERES